MLPRAAKRAAGRLRAELVRAQVCSELRRLARSGRPIIAGPMLGEVGFEILYWVPFLRWAVEVVGLDPARIVAVSRGGPAAWYEGVAGRYVDVFDYVSVDVFRERNRQRQAVVGEQKQVRAAAFDGDIVRRIRAEAGLSDAVQLHPSLMYRLFQPYWWRHASSTWVDCHTLYRFMPHPSLPELGLRAAEYVAVKFYVNDCMPDGADTRQFAARIIERLASEGPVVSLSTALAVDDHPGVEVPGDLRVRTLTSLVGARTNLALQAAVVANARAFVGTYGGFSYLAPLYRVPATVFYAARGRFDGAHLAAAQRAFERIGAPSLDLRVATGDGAVVEQQQAC